ncbi:phosphoribosylglycinamide formyltransferase [Bacteroidota bacterium]
MAVFASGSGTNAENIIRFFRPNNKIDIKLIVSNKPDAKVLERAENHNVDHFVFTREQFYQSDYVVQQLQHFKIDFIVLAGFLWLIPENLIKAYPDKIVNIHPALLPKYGGKGMYGSRVHESVIANKEKESGITIHYVNERYDEGNIIYQATCPVEEEDTPDSLAAKIHELEYAYYPKVIEELLNMTMS